MEVSTFELIFKPQSPAAPANVAAVDRVIQGYFLAITNLEPVEYRYRVEFIVPDVPANTPNGAFRTPAGNTLVFVDSGGGDNAQGVLNGPFSTRRYLPSTGFVRIPAFGTALVAVLPSAFGPLPGETTPLVLPNFETRGYVTIGLPAVRRGGGGLSAFQTQPQSNAPVRVLLTPQHRATFLKADNTIASQVQATLPLAGGAAATTLAPEPGGFIFDDFVVAAAQPNLGVLLDSIQPADRGTVLAALLADLDPATADLPAMNRALADAGVGLAVERRKK